MVVRGWQGQFELALIVFVSVGEVAVHAPGQHPAHGETEPNGGRLAFSMMGSLVWVEDGFPFVFGDTLTVVSHLDDDESVSAGDTNLVPLFPPAPTTPFAAFLSRQ